MKKSWHILKHLLMPAGLSSCSKCFRDWPVHSQANHALWSQLLFFHILHHLMIKRLTYRPFHDGLDLRFDIILNSRTFLRTDTGSWGFFSWYILHSSLTNGLVLWLYECENPRLTKPNCNNFLEIHLSPASCIFIGSATDMGLEICWGFCWHLTIRPSGQARYSNILKFSRP